MLKLVPRMGLLLLVVVASAGVAVGVELPARDQWVAFASDDGKVTAQFPKAPKENTQKVDSAIGPLKVSMHIAETGGTAFMVSHLTYPVDPAQYDAKEGLAGAVKGAADNIGGVIDESADIKLSGFNGREVLIRGKQGLYVRGRLAIDAKGPTLFQCLVVGSKDFVTSEDATFFLDSVKVK